MRTHIITRELIPGSYVAFGVELYSAVRNTYEHVSVAGMIYELKQPTFHAPLNRFVQTIARRFRRLARLRASRAEIRSPVNSPSFVLAGTGESVNNPFP
jgi:hypothetical protein